MGRPGLSRHPKFRRLCALLGKPRARGVLEFLWETAYELCSDVIGDSRDIELAAEWDGEGGELTSALVTCGFVDQIDTDKFAVHDLWDHCPDYVRKRRSREEDRRRRGQTTAQRPVSDRSVTGQSPPFSGQCPPFSGQCPPFSGQCPPFGDTPAPAPTPAPIDTHSDSEETGEVSAPDRAERVRSKNPVPHLDIVASWNTMASTRGLPVVDLVTKARKGAMNARAREIGVEGIKRAFEEVAKSAFLTGATEAGFRASFDWVLAPRNMAKILEGNYRDRVQPRRLTLKEQWAKADLAVGGHGEEWPYPWSREDEEKYGWNEARDDYRPEWEAYRNDCQRAGAWVPFLEWLERRIW